MLKKSLILFFCALIVGAAVSWNRADGPIPTFRETTRETLPRPSPTHAIWTNDDFLKLARDRAELKKQPDYNPLSQKLADWTNEEIIAALNASLTDPDIVLMAGAANDLDGDLLGEWMRRDFDSALAWFEKLESRAAKGRLAVRLSDHWPADKGGQGLEFLRANRELFPSIIGWKLKDTVFESSVRDGPLAFEKLLRVMREDQLQLYSKKSMQFPENFDFHVLVQGGEFEILWNAGDADLIVQSWYSQDRDKAFDWLLEKHGATALSAIIDSSEGKASENLKWLGGKFAALDAEQRADLSAEIANVWAIDPDPLTRFIQSINDPTALDEARKMGVQTLFAGNVRQFVPVLEAMENPTRRISLLENAEPSALFIESPELRRLGDSDEELLRERLANWKASPAQIESIISRFKP